MQPTSVWEAFLHRGKAFLNKENYSDLEKLHFAQRFMGFEDRTKDYKTILNSAVGLELMFNIDLGKLPYSDEVSIPESLIYYKGKMISHKLVRKLWTYFTIKKHIKKSPLKVLEIGGGYGMLAYIFTDNDYTIIDFPVCLEFVKSYSRLKGFNVKLLPIETPITEHYDLIINENSLQEMNKEGRDYWIEIINNHCDYFFSMNYGVWDRGYEETVGINPLGGWDNDLWEVMEKVLDPPLETKHRIRLAQLFRGINGK
jgi:hypothetical protein